MFAFLKKKKSWKPPEPRCIFAVACAAPALPPLERLAHPAGKEDALPGIPTPPARTKEDPGCLTRPLEGGDTSVIVSPGKARFSVIVDRSPEMLLGFPGRSMPPETWKFVGLNGDLARRAREARSLVMVSLLERGQNLAQDVLYATRLADRVSVLADGCVNDLMGCRYFGSGSWRIPESNREVDVREHVVLHGEKGDSKGMWVHTHGLIKFARPELEIYEVPEDLWEGVSLAMLDMMAYVIAGPLIRPGETVGIPEVPLRAREGTRNRERHWGDCAVLELVDVDPRREPLASGAERGLRALLASRGSR
jgi:hypothetical protein